MNGRIFNMDIPAHQAVQELLPWFASAQLAPAEAAKVQAHLQGCAQCRQALEWERELRAATLSQADPLPPGVDLEGALARLLPALGAQDEALPASAAPALQAAPAVPAAKALRWWRTMAANQPRWWRWTVAAQWVLIVGLLALMLRPAPDPAPYRVLGSGVAAEGNLVVVFQPNTSERELRRILQAQGARVVDGPTVTDAYLLNVAAADRGRALQALRAEPAVKLAEALDGGSAP